MLRFASHVCAWALVAVPVLGQQAPPNPATIMDYLDKQTAPLASAWLHSADPRTKAWGAYLVLHDRHTEAIPTLLSMLAAYPVVEELSAPTDLEEHDVMLGVLDALIQFGADVPVADAQRIYAEFPVQSLILLARSQEDALPGLLEIFKSERRRPATWLAAGAVLLQRRAAGFAAIVVESMTVHALVTVTEPNVGGGMGGSSACCGSASPAPSKVGWPPLGVYAFGGCGNHLQPGAIVLAAGPEPAYYYRQVNTSYQVDGASSCCNVDPDLVSQHYLTTLLFDSAEQPLVHAYISHTITWRGVEAYRSELAAFVGQQQHLFAELSQRLSAVGLISSAEAQTLRPALDIRVWDLRAPHELALPAFRSFADNVTVQLF